MSRWESGLKQTLRKDKFASVVELVDTLDSKSNASNSVWVRLPPEVRINHNKVEIQASFKKEARLFFGAMRRVSCCGFQNEREGRNYSVIQPHLGYKKD